MIAALGAGLVLALTGCSSMMETGPSDEVEKDVILSDAEGMEVALNGIYATMYTRLNFVTANAHHCFGNLAVTLAAELMGEDMVHTAQGAGWFWKDYTYDMRSRYSSKIWRSYFTWAYFYELITEHTKAARDQDHIDIILSSRATTPDRTAYILGESEDSPLPAMIADARSLEDYGATAIVIPCNTAHYFIDEVRRSVSVPMPSIITETVRHIARRGFRRAAILATAGTIKAGSYEREFRSFGLECAVPDEAGTKRLMEIIYDEVKGGRIPPASELYEVTEPMFRDGCDCAILGCTELPMLARRVDLGLPVVDTLQVHVRSLVDAIMDE